MNLPDIGQLAKVIDLCRKKGVSTFQLGELKLEFGPEPVRQSKVQRDQTAQEPDESDPWANFPSGTLTNEQLMYYSAGGVPGKEPWLNTGEPAKE